MPTLEDLDYTVISIRRLADGLRNKVYPNGKPDWMPQESWNNICSGDIDCPLKLDKIHCQNCFFNARGKCEYERIIKDEQTQG